MSTEHKRSSFAGTFGFVMAAAGSAVGLGNIWRFPYLAAKHGGVFILCYIVLALTFGFAMLTSEIAIGRRTGQSPLTAYGVVHKKWSWLGILACIVPAMILPYYCAIGGWVTKYTVTFITGNGAEAADPSFFGGFITALGEPIVWLVVFLGITTFIVYAGVNNGIEKFSKVLMPILVVLIIFIACYSLTLSYTDAEGVTRTGMEGLKVYLYPDFTGMTFKKFSLVLMDAMGQLFYSISVAMGIMIAYGSYVKKEANLIKSINQIEFFDTLVALLAGMMIVPAVFVFSGTEGMSAGPSLMFKSLPQTFQDMGKFGTVIGILFFFMVLFAALTSSVSIMEAVVASLMDKFKWSRKKSTLLTGIYALIVGIIVCLGYNLLYFEVTLPNGAVAQVLDVLDYISNNILMPIIAFGTCILIGWVVKPKYIEEEITLNGNKFSRKNLYIVMTKYITPILLAFLFLQALGISF